MRPSELDAVYTATGLYGARGVRCRIVWGCSPKDMTETKGQSTTELPKAPGTRRRLHPLAEEPDGS